MNSVLVTLSMSRWIRVVVVVVVVVVVPAARAALFPKTKSKHIYIYIYYYDSSLLSGRRSALSLSCALFPKRFSVCVFVL